MTVGQATYRGHLAAVAAATAVVEESHRRRAHTAGRRSAHHSPYARVSARTTICRSRRRDRRRRRRQRNPLPSPRSAPSSAGTGWHEPRPVRTTVAGRRRRRGSRSVVAVPVLLLHAGRSIRVHRVRRRAARRRGRDTRERRQRDRQTDVVRVAGHRVSGDRRVKTRYFKRPLGPVRND